MSQFGTSDLEKWAELATIETLRYSGEQNDIVWEGEAQHSLMMTGWVGEVLTVQDAVMLLWSQQSFPRAVDLAVRGCSP
jgi:hypothetical protein